MNGIVRSLQKTVPGIRVRLYQVKNEFFGGGVTVTGLLTGRDILSALTGAELGEELILSRTMLRAEGDLFLCGMTPEELSARLGVRLVFAENDGGDFLLRVLGID